MSEKFLNSRIVHKHDSESNWNKAINFVPKQGELIIYDKDETHNYVRLKVGDGTSNVNDLPFIDETKVDKVDGKQLSTNDYTTEEKDKLTGIEDGANKTVVDDTLSSTSTNPVQNKIVTTEINDLKTLVGDTSVAEQINTAAINNQSDWNVNDESSASFIKNRTHWVAPITNVVFENSSAAFSALDDMYICNESLGFTVSEKSTYLVNWDGVDYNCVPHIYSSMTTIGNVSIINGPDETDEPFVIFMSDSDTLCFTSSTATTHSIVVTETSERVHKIDEKFLPDDIAFKSDIPDMPTVPTKVSELTNDVDYVTLVKGESKNFEFVRDETYSGNHFIYNGFDYYKVSDIAPIYDDVSAVSGTWYANGNLSTQNNLVEGTSCYYAGHSIVVTEAGACTLSGKTFNAPSIGIYFKKSSDTYYQTALSITCAYKRLSDSVIPDTIARVEDVPDAVTVDSTLSIEGQAADAKVTGDAISNLNTLVGDTSVSDQINAAISGSKIVGAEVTATAADEMIASNRIAYVAENIDPESWTHSSNIYADANNTSLSDYAYTACMSPDKTLLVLGGKNYVKLYSVTDDAITYLSDIYADNNSTAFSGSVVGAEFSPDGNMLLLYGSFTGKAKYYTVSGQSIIYVSDVYADNSSTALSGDVAAGKFSPSGSILILSGYFSGFAKAYSVTNNTITYIQNIYSDKYTNSLNQFATTVAFAPLGDKFVVGGNFSNYLKCYTLSGNTITYACDIGTFDGYITEAVFSADGNLLAISGNFSGQARLFSVSRTTFTAIQDFYMDNDNTAFSTTVNGIKFTPDGKYAFLRGDFTGKVKIYSVSSSGATYIKDLPGKGAETALTSASSNIYITPDGKRIILCIYSGGYNALVYTLKSTYLAYLGTSNSFNDYRYKVGIAQGDIPVGTSGIIKIVATVDKTILLPKKSTISLPAANWNGSANPWSQVVTINGVTANSKVDLQPTAAQIVELQNADIAFMVENNDGVITVYAIGSKPTVDYTMQVLITEVVHV